MASTYQGESVTFNPSPDTPLGSEECKIAFGKCGFNVTAVNTLVRQCQKVAPSFPNLDQLVAFSSNYLFRHQIRIASLLDSLLLAKLYSQLSFEGIAEPSPLAVICCWRRHVTQIFVCNYHCLAETFSVLSDYVIPEWLCRDALHCPYPSMELFYYSVCGQVFWSVGNKCYKVVLHLPDKHMEHGGGSLHWFPTWNTKGSWSSPDFPSITPQETIDSLGEEIRKAIRTSSVLDMYNLFFESTDETLLSYVRPVALYCISQLLTSRYNAVYAQPNESDHRFEIYFDSQEKADQFSLDHAGIDCLVHQDPSLLDLGNPSKSSFV